MDADREGRDGGNGGAGPEDRPASADDGPPADAPADRAPSRVPDEADRERPEREFGSPPDDDEIRTLPVRRLPLAANDPAEGGRRQRAWHWVPLGALVTLGTTTLAAFVATAAVPETEEAVQAFGEAVGGVQNDDERLAAVDALMSGPMAATLERVLIAMTLAFGLGVITAAFIACAFGSAGILEAALGAVAFVTLSFLFMGVGISPLALPSAGFAFGLAALGAWLGLRLRRWRVRRRASRT